MFMMNWILIESNIFLQSVSLIQGLDIFSQMPFMEALKRELKLFVQSWIKNKLFEN